jgi:hypothetical protein
LTQSLHGRDDGFGFSMNTKGGKEYGEGYFIYR